MTNKELAKQIRQELKEAGYNAKMVSVIVKDTCGDTVIRATIKAPSVNRSEIERALKKYEEIEWDANQMEILSGANTYIRVEYAYGVIEEAAKQYENLAAEAVEKDEECGEIVPGLFLIKDRGDLIVKEVDKIGSRLCRSVEEIAVYIFKFKEFNNIFA